MQVWHGASLQAKVLQSRSCTAATSGHARCGWEAGGWYTAVRDWRPPLHATEHADQADHGPTSHDGVAGTSHWGPVHAAGSSHVHTPGWPRSHSPRPWQKSVRQSAYEEKHDRSSAPVKASSGWGDVLVSEKVTSVLLR